MAKAGVIAHLAEPADTSALRGPKRRAETDKADAKLCANSWRRVGCPSVGPLSSLALCAWLGGADRFSSSRKAVRFVGLDITVHSSDGKRSPGRLSRQGPEVLRWLLFEAAKTSARACAPGYGYYSQAKDRYDANRACLSQARRIVRHATHILTGLGDDAFTNVAQPAAPTTIAR